MKAEDIRKVTIARSEKGYGGTALHSEGDYKEFTCAMLQEIAAQLAEQNDYLLKVLEFNTAQLENSKRSVDWMIERDKRAEARAISELELISKMDGITRNIDTVREMISPAPASGDAPDGQMAPRESSQVGK